MIPKISDRISLSIDMTVVSAFFLHKKLSNLLTFGHYGAIILCGKFASRLLTRFFAFRIGK